MEKIKQDWETIVELREQNQALAESYSKLQIRFGEELARVNSLSASHRELYEASKTIRDRIDAGDLVRDISHDHEDGFYIRQAKFVMDLKAWVISIRNASELLVPEKLSE